MKALFWVGAALLVSGVTLRAQIPDTSTTQPGLDSGSGSESTSGGSSSRLGEWRATRLSWCATRWEGSVEVTNQITGQVEIKGLRYIEVGDGLNYLDPQGRWQPSEDSIQAMTNGGAAALRGPTKVYFPPTLGRQDQPLTLISASNTVLRVRPAGVYYTDYESGESYLLGTVREVDGQLVGVNQVVYPAAISDELTADIIYIYNKGIFESDLLILEQPRLAPQDVGLNPETTRLELVTLVEGDAPRRSPRVLKRETDPVRRAQLGEHADFVDETLDYGPDLFFPMGRAFSVDGEQSANPGTPGAPVQIRAKGVDLDEEELPVGKTWMQFDEQRQGLVEAVIWLDIEPKLRKLPKAGRRAEGAGATRQAERGRRLPKLAGGPRTPAKEMALAKTAHRASGVLLDYQTVSGNGPFTFANDTYYLTNPITVMDAVTFGPSAVLKYGTNNNVMITIAGNGSVTCTGSTVMTSEDDDSYGTTLPWSIHVPRGSSYLRAVHLQQLAYVPRTFSGLRIRYAKGGLYLVGGGVANHTVSNCAFEESTNCQFAVYASGSQVTLNNSTVCHIAVPTLANATGSFVGSLTDVCSYADTDSDGLPDAWELDYFGSLAQNSDGDYDSDGYSNLTEAADLTDPNTISFSVDFDSNPLASSLASGSITTLGGVPAEMAIQVGQGSFSWQPFQPTFVATLPSMDGRYEVRVGLRGRAANAQETWHATTVVRDTTPPSIVITSPTAGTVSQSFIQLQGQTPEPLSSLTYDIANNAGSVTGLQGLIKDRFYDSQLHDFTTTFFQCYDVELVPGLNTITLHAKDLAGNTALASVTLSLVSDGVAPAINLRWPQNNMRLSGDSFTLDGWLDDPSARVTATLRDASGQDTTFTGLVERDGRFWVENMPLAAGASVLTITAKDCWNNSSSTVLTVTRSALAFTIATIDENALHQKSIFLAGYVPSDYTVRVNGLPATVQAGQWTLYAPVNPGTTASFTAVAYPAGHDGDASFAVQTSANADKPPRLYIQRHILNTSLHIQNHREYFENGGTGPGLQKDVVDTEWLETNSHDWQDQTQSSGSWYQFQSAESWEEPYHQNICNGTINWPATAWPEIGPGTWTWNQGDCYSPRWPDNCITMEHCISTFREDVSWPPTQMWTTPSPGEYISGTAYQDYFRVAESIVKFSTGGKALPQRDSLFSFYVQAFEIPDPRRCLREPGDPPIPADKIKVGEFGAPGADYWLYKALPSGVTKDLTVRADGKKHFSYTIDQQKHELKISANGMDIEEGTPEFCVGQKVELAATWNPNLPVGTQSRMRWTIASAYCNKIIPAQGEVSPYYTIDSGLLGNPTSQIWWYDGGSKPAWCTWTNDFPNGQSVAVRRAGNVTVSRPTLSAFSCQTPRSFMWLTAGGVDTLSYGDLSTGVNGLSWTADVASTYEGRWTVTQLFQARYYVTPGAFDIINTLGLRAVDAGEYYDGITHVYSVGVPGTHAATLEDFPSLTCLGTSALIQVESAEDYIRFKPGRLDNDGNIYVTLGIVRWNARGEYSRALGWIANSTPAATGPDTSSEFPTWTRIVRSHQ